MISPSVKATEPLDIPPPAKKPPRRGIPDYDDRKKVNVNYSLFFDTRTDTFQ